MLQRRCADFESGPELRVSFCDTRMSIAVSVTYGAYQSPVGMSYFGRYGHASDRSTSLTLASYRGIHSDGDKLELLARQIEDVYVNYNSQRGSQRPIRQPKIGCLDSPRSSPSNSRERTHCYTAGKRSCSVPVIPTLSILKPSNSPPSSPKGKKTVRFADSQGLPLVTVHRKSDSDQDELGLDRVNGGFVRLSLKDEGKALKARHKIESPPDSPISPRHELDYHFTQPGIETDFMQHVLTQKVCLENIRHDGGNLLGVVRVSNLDFHKVVSIRWTNDKWRSVHDKPGVYCGSSDGVSDRFSFQLPLSGSQLEFAICYSVAGTEFWDNNRGKNYVITIKSLHPH